MLRKLQSRLTYANVMATIAVFGVLAGGVAWALDRNEVKSRHIAPNQVKAADTSNKLRLECPGGTRYHEGACIETGGRTAANSPNAITDCADEAGGARLPSLAELESFAREPGIILDAGNEWSSHLIDASNALAVGDGGTPVIDEVGAMNEYRCVFPPKR